MTGVKMKITNLLLMTLLAVGIAPHALADADSDDCDMPKANRMVVLALYDALKDVNFPDCRIEISEHGVSLEHGREHGWVNFNRRRTEINLGSGSVLISGYQRATEEIASWYQDKFNFVLSADQKRIVEVDYSQYIVQEVNQGTILQPVYKPVKTRVNLITCKEN